MYPYEDRLLEKIKNEIWKDIPNYEGYYQASNYGRIKSLDRIIPHPRLYQQFVEGRILKQKILKDYNKLTGDAMISMQVSLALENTVRNFNVRRLIYMTFKSKIDFEKDGLYVINIDGDGYNNKLSNLKLVTKSKKQRRSIDNGRQDFGYLKTIDRSSWKKSLATSLAVSQYTLDGTLVKTYKSLRSANALTHIDAKGISLAAKGHYKGIWSGYKWVFVKASVK